MDVVTMWTIIFIAAGATVTFGSPILKGIEKLVVKMDERHQERKRMKPLSKKELKREAEERARKYRPIRNEKVAFKNIRSNEKSDVVVNLFTKFDPDQDEMFKGFINRPNHKREMIYLFQPRVTFENGVKAGPQFSNGKLSDTYTYLYKSNGQYLEGYFPKREVVSSVEFDYIHSSKHARNKYLEDFLSVDLPTDDKGNFIPVDLSDPDEQRDFNAYLEKHKNDGIDDISYFERIVKDANEDYEEDRKRRIEELSKDFDGKIRVQRVKEQKEKNTPSANDLAIEEYRREIANKERAYDLRYVTDHEPDDPLKVNSSRPRGGAPIHEHGRGGR